MAGDGILGLLPVFKENYGVRVWRVERTTSKAWNININVWDVQKKNWVWFYNRTDKGVHG